MQYEIPEKTSTAGAATMQATTGDFEVVDKGEGSSTNGTSGEIVTDDTVVALQELLKNAFLGGAV